MAPSPELAERIRWFIRLRWLAAAGIVVAAAVVASLGVPISWRPLVGLGVLLGGFNVVFAILARGPFPPLPLA